MTPKTTQTQANRNDDIEARVALLEYQFREVRKALVRIESKQEAAIRQIDTLKYVSTGEFELNKEMTGKIYATKNEVSGLTRLLYWILGLIGTIFTVGIAALIGIVIK